MPYDNFGASAIIPELQTIFSITSLHQMTLSLHAVTAVVFRQTSFFGKGWEKSIWNCTVLRRIYDDILAVRETDGGWGLPDVSEDYLIGLLYMQLKRSREAWSRMQPRFLSDSSRGETSQEAAERVIRQTEQHYHTNSSRSHRQRVSFNFLFHT